MDLPAGVIPVRDATTQEILYGSRRTRFRYELLSHDSSTGVDSLAGYLDGVVPGGTVRWQSAAAVKKQLDVDIRDLKKVKSGLLGASDIDLNTTRIRPVMMVDGLPEIPLSSYVATSVPEEWEGTGRTYRVSMRDRSTVLDQDRVDETYTADTSTPILQHVQALIASSGEKFSVDGSNTKTLASPLVRPAGTTKLQIVNDLLGALNYNSLWVDGLGSFRATPYVRPALRSILYDLLNDEEGNRLVRELTDGAQSIYSPKFTRDRDIYGVPNKVIAIAAPVGDEEPLVGVATNEDPNSPFSYQSLGNRWRVAEPLENVDVPDFSGEADPEAATVAFLNDVALRSLIARSAVQDAVSIDCLPIPLELLDALRFAHTPSGIDGRHTVRSMSLRLQFSALMSLDLQEVIDL